eukprot:8566591-Heterocapsa_arctica.AAC.1
MSTGLLGGEGPIERPTRLSRVFRFAWRMRQGSACIVSPVMRPDHRAARSFSQLCTGATSPGGENSS